jgi:hypothetical protein
MEFWTGDADLENNIYPNPELTLILSMQRISNLISSPKHPTLIFLLICFRRIWNFTVPFSDAFAFFIKDLTAGEVNQKSCSSSVLIFPFQLKPFETILTIQIVLLQIKATLVHTTLVVLDLQLILMDKRSRCCFCIRIRHYTYL